MFNEDGVPEISESLVNKYEASYKSRNSNVPEFSPQSLEEIANVYNTNNLSTIGTFDEYISYVGNIFPDSKVKDVLYHGGNEGIENFDPERLGEKTGANSAMLGFFFSDNKNISLSYIQRDFIDRVGELKELTDAYDSTLNELDSQYQKTSDELKQLRNEAKSLITKIVDFIKKLLNHRYLTTNDRIKNKLEEFYRIGEEYRNMQSTPRPTATRLFSFEDFKVNSKIEEGKKLYQVRINTENPFFADYTNDKTDGGAFYSDSIKEAINSGNDSAILTNVLDVGKLSVTQNVFNDETKKYELYINNEATYEDHYIGNDYVVFKPEQIHILGSKSDIEGFQEWQGTKEGQQAFLQIQNEILPKSSPLTLRKVKIMMDRMGVNYETVKNIVVNGKRLNANGVALPLQSLIQVTEGQEQALPEEAFHIGIEILEQTNKGLVNQMLSKATSLPIWDQVYEQYKDLYNNDLRKIKKEAIAKQLVIESETPVQSWWQKALSYLRGLFQGTQVDLNPFQDALSVLTNNNIGTVRNTLLNNLQYLQEQGITDEAAQNIIQLANSTINNDSLQEAIQQYLPENVFLQVGGINVNPTYDKLKSSRDTSTSKDILDQAEETLKRNYGNSQRFLDAWDEISNQENRDGHKDVMDVLRRYLDENGILRENPLRDTNESSEKYDEIEDLVADRLVSFPKDTRFLTNLTIVDKATDTKGNIDLVAVTNDGVVSTFNFIASYEDSINNVKKSVYATQIQTLKDILKRNYGIRRFGQNRTVPIAMNLEEVQSESYIDITPVTDRTDITAVDKLLNALNSRMNALRQAKSTREKKSLDVTADKLLDAINTLLVTGSFQKIVRLGQAAVNDAQNLLDDSTNRTGGYVANLALVQDNLIALKDINSVIASAAKSKNELFKGNKKGLSQASQISNDAGNLLEEIEELQNVINNENAENQNVQNVLQPEATVNTMTKWFRKLSQAQTKATRYLYSLTSNLERNIDVKLTDRLKGLTVLRDEVTTWAQSRNIKNTGILKQIMKPNKFELIDQYDNVAYVTGLQEAQKNKDNKWIDNNVDLTAYNEWLKQERDEFYSQVDRKTYDFRDDTRDADLRQQQKDWFEETYNIYSENNGKIRQFPNQNFLTQDYKNLQTTENKPIFNLYNYIRNLNDQAEASGALQEWQSKVILPMMRKDLLDKLVFGGARDLQLGADFFRSIAGSEEAFQYGERDPKTGEIVDKIPFYYIKDISSVKGDGTRDYSNISTDIFKVLAIYERQVLKYEAYSQVEAETSLMLRSERAKESLPTGRFGDVKEGEGTIQNNEVNAKYYENFLRAKVYGQRNIGNKWDSKIVKLSLSAAKKFNTLVGREIINTDYDQQYVSLVGAIDGINRFFQMKVLGLNPVVSIANFFGGNMQALIEGGRYFTKREFIAAEMEYAGGKVQKGHKMIALLDYFDYLYDGERTRELSQQLSFSKLTQTSIQEKLYTFQRISEKPIQGAFAIALARNTIVEEGELVNIREYLKNSPKYASIYDLQSKADRDALQRELDEDVKKLQERSIFNIAEFQDDKLVIPGVERDSQQVSRYIEFNQQLTRQATGGGNQDDIRQINMLLLGRSAMMFKSWVVPLLLNRFQGLTYNVGRDAYEMGRITAVFQNISLNLNKSSKDLHGIITGNNRGIELLKQRYEIEKEKYLNRTGQDDFEKQFTEREFIDMYQAAVKNSMQDVLMLTGILGMIAAVGAMQPPEDEEVKLGSWKWAMRNLNKIEDELSFFYSPTKLLNVANGGLLPAAGVLKDLIKLTDHTTRELGATIYNDPEAAEKAKPTKYLMKSFPVLKQMDQFIVIFNTQLADELGLDIVINEQPR